jgi:hypothetical protein
MRLIKIPKFSEKLKVREARGYELARQLPLGVRVELGRQVRIDEDAFEEWVASGGVFRANGDGNGNEECAA